MKTFKEYVKSTSGKIVDSSESPLNKKRSEPTSPLNSNEEVQKALQSDATSRKIMEKGIEHKDGDLVGARLNLNVLNNNDNSIGIKLREENIMNNTLTSDTPIPLDKIN